MEMELLIKDKSSKPLTWLLFGNYQPFSYAKTISMEWVLPMPELQPIPSTTLEERLFQDLSVMLRMS
jgi:hypothetical protein